MAVRWQFFIRANDGLSFIVQLLENNEWKSFIQSPSKSSTRVTATFRGSREMHWRHMSAIKFQLPATRLFVQQFVKENANENMRYWPLVMGSHYRVPIFGKHVRFMTWSLFSPGNCSVVCLTWSVSRLDLEGASEMWTKHFNWNKWMLTYCHLTPYNKLHWNLLGNMG